MSNSNIYICYRESDKPLSESPFQILPINIKGSAGSLTALINCFTSWIVSYAFNFLFEWNAAGNGTLHLLLKLVWWYHYWFIKFCCNLQEHSSCLHSFVARLLYSLQCWYQRPKEGHLKKSRHRWHYSNDIICSLTFIPILNFIVQTTLSFRTETHVYCDYIDVCYVPI